MARDGGAVRAAARGVRLAADATGNTGHESRKWRACMVATLQHSCFVHDTPTGIGAGRVWLSETAATRDVALLASAETAQDVESR